MAQAYIAHCQLPPHHYLMGFLNSIPFPPGPGHHTFLTCSSGNSYWKNLPNPVTSSNANDTPVVSSNIHPPLLKTMLCPMASCSPGLILLSPSQPAYPSAHNFPLTPTLCWNALLCPLTPHPTFPPGHLSCSLPSLTFQPGAITPPGTLLEPYCLILQH